MAVYPELVDLYEARRQTLLRLLASERFGGNQRALAEAAELSPSYLSRMLKPADGAHRKRIGDDMAIRMEETLRLPSGYLLSPEFGVGDAPSSGAHAMSYQPFDHPLLTREELMTMGELPARFVFALEDDAMGEHGRAGTEVLFHKAGAAKVGAGVLVRDKAGALHVRRKAQGHSDAHWLGLPAKSMIDTYRTLDSEADGLQILAVWRGVVNRGLEDF
jgi:hypothetical protein